MTVKSASLRKPVSLTEFFLQWEWILVLLLVLTSAVNTILSPYFLNWKNIMDTTGTFMERGLMTLPMTFVIITGGIDLSVASNLAMTAAIMGRLFMGGTNIWAAAGLALIVATMAGLFNGLLIARIKLPPLAATLGTYVLYRGIAWMLLEDGAATNLPADFLRLGQGTIAGTAIPVPLIIYIVLLIPFGLALHRTTFGRYTYAYGNNKEACRYSGVNTGRLLLVIFTLSGLIAGLAGVITASRFGSARGDIATGAELDVITAVVLGGVDINGGSGGIIGVVLALFLLGELRYGMNLLNIAPQNQIIVTGFLLIFSIIVPQLVRRMTTSRPTRYTASGAAVKRTRPTSTWLFAGGGALVVLLAMVLMVQRCSGPSGPAGPGGAAPVPGAPAGTEVAAAEATATEFVLPPTNTPVPPPPTRTPRPTATAKPSEAAPTNTVAAAATAAPTTVGQATVASTRPAAATESTGSAEATPTRTPIVMEMAPTPPPAPAAPESDMVDIPAGPFTMGADDGNQNETPVHTVDLPAFQVDRFEVTNADFDSFAQATGYKTGPEQSGANKTWRSAFTPDKADHPVVKVTFADATAYCQWAGKRLPTEAEWEKAARGTDKRTYPWGNLWNNTQANVRLTGLRGTAAVGSFPGGASPFGVQDMAGNVGEWTNSVFGPYPGSAYRDPQYREQARVTRGGGWFDDDKQVRTTARNGAVMTTANDDLGFRCAVDKK